MTFVPDGIVPDAVVEDLAARDGTLLVGVVADDAAGLMVDVAGLGCANATPPASIAIAIASEMFFITIR